MQFRINTSGLLETLILYKALSTSAGISAMRRIPVDQHDVLHLLLLCLDKDDLYSRTCPRLFTNHWPMAPYPYAHRASFWECFMEGQMEVQLHSKEC